MEYALKTTGLLIKENGPAEANWQRFADKIDPALAIATDTDLKAAIAFVLTEPPRKQAVQGGKLKWIAGDPGSQSRARLLVIYVCRIRNNLFHGGKFNGTWFDPERSEKLLQAALVILRYFSDVNDDVRTAFHSS
jgi:hypothetical protein